MALSLQPCVVVGGWRQVFGLNNRSAAADRAVAVCTTAIVHRNLDLYGRARLKGNGQDIEKQTLYLRSPRSPASTPSECSQCGVVSDTDRSRYLKGHTWSYYPGVSEVIANQERRFETAIPLLQM